MADDKPMLTRRRVLGGMATIGAAGAVGAGAWAGYSDPETAQLTANAGTLNIVLQKGTGSNKQTFDGDTAPFTVDEIDPGETKESVIRVRNPSASSSVTAKAIGVEITNVSSGEGDNPESETNTSGSGELDDQLGIAVGYHGGVDLIGHPSTQYPNLAHFVDFNDARSHGAYTANGINLPPSNNDYQDLKVDLHYKDLDPSQNNKAQGDTLTFDLKVTAYQNEQ